MKLHLGSVHKNKVVFTLMKIVNLHPENLMKYVRLLSYYQTWELNTILKFVSKLVQVHMFIQTHVLQLCEFSSLVHREFYGW
jgi:hypothetical protein